MFVSSLINSTRYLLGEESIHAPTERVWRDLGVTDFPVGRGRGFKVKVSTDMIEIWPYSAWASFSGFSSFYRFKGNLIEKNNQSELSGRILTAFVPKMFILLWMIGIFLSLFVAIIVTIYGSMAFVAGMPNPDVESKQLLIGGGVIIGFSLTLVAFGFGIFGLLRFIKRRERKELIEFCQRFARGEMHQQEP